MIELFYTYVSEQAKKNCKEVLDSGFLNQGPRVAELESVMSSEFGMSNPVTMNSCTSALHVALEICDVRGLEVILPAQTFIATGLAVLMAGGIPVFADIDDDGQINLQDVVNNITDNTAAIIGVDWAGNECGISELHKLDAGIPIILDAAHSFGRIDKNADFICYSFQSIKTLTCGDGGLLDCKDVHHAEIAKELRWFGINKDKMIRTAYGDRDFPITRLGYKYNMNDIDASLVLGNAIGIHNRLERRRNNYSRYLSEIQNKDVKVIRHSDNSTHWLCNLLVTNQLSFIEHMRKNDVQTSVVDRRIDTHPIFHQTNDLPGQCEYDNKQVNIPVHENLSCSQIDHIINAVNTWRP